MELIFEFMPEDKLLREVSDNNIKIKQIARHDLELIFDGMPGNHLLIKADPPVFTIVAAGKSHLEMTGRIKENVVGKGVFEVFPPNPDSLGVNSMHDLTASFMEAIETKKVSFLPAQRYDLGVLENTEYVEKFWRIRNTPVNDDNNMVSFIINSVEDVTSDVLARRHQEQIKILNQSHNLYMQAPMAIQIFKAPDLTIELANNVTLKMWGRGPEVIGKPLVEVFPELKDEGFEILMMDVIETGISKTFYERPIMLNRNGQMETIWFNFTYQPYYEDLSSKPVGVLVFADEVTDRIVAKKLIETNNQLERKNIELEKFAYIASHDLQEPLRKVNFFIRMLETNIGELDEQSKEYINKIVSSTARMSNLIRDVLDFSRLTLMHSDKQSVDLNELVAGTLSDFEVIIKETRAKVEVSNLPTITAIPLQMQQLFHNLMSNALKFRNQNATPVISISSKLIPKSKLNQTEVLFRDSNYYEFNFRDNGIGFDNKYSERIFGIFQRLHARQEYEGTGVGLALCKKIVENHGGLITATSRPHHGSEFKIILPDVTS
jgi:signal transduction histidine kinase